MRRITFMLLCSAAAMAGPALAATPTAEMARICRQQALEAYPTPRIGSMQGAETAQRGHFRDCVAKMQGEQRN
jgi:hypothetical protein